MSESFAFDVAYSTTFEDLERLREKMLEFVTEEKRDYQPVFDVTVKGPVLFAPVHFAEYNCLVIFQQQIFLNNLK